MLFWMGGEVENKGKGNSNQNIMYKKMFSVIEKTTNALTFQHAASVYDVCVN